MKEDYAIMQMNKADCMIQRRVTDKKLETYFDS